MMVGMRLELGVSMCEIRDLIETLASEGCCQRKTEGIAGFLSVEDIPQHLRNEFLVALASLSGPPGYRHAPGRTLSANDIWR
jgi:hypothetical protein